MIAEDIRTTNHGIIKFKYLKSEYVKSLDSNLTDPSIPSNMYHS